MTNFNQLMKEKINSLNGKKKLLLHSCCAPCSSHCIKVLKDYFNITVIYYNPNIDDQTEYLKRKAEQMKFLQTTGWASFLDVESNIDDFYTYIRGLEGEKEGGARCKKCYKLRMSKTACVAREKGFDFFTTTLSVSPLKNANWINEIGFELEKLYQIEFLPCDFKKENGYLDSINLSKEYNLYRQNYCGCSFSKNNISNV